MNVPLCLFSRYESAYKLNRHYAAELGASCHEKGGAQGNVKEVKANCWESCGPAFATMEKAFMEDDRKQEEKETMGKPNKHGHINESA